MDIFSYCVILEEMQRFIFILTLFAFLAGGLANIAHAAMPDMACAHQSVDVQSVDQNCAEDQTKDNVDFEQCQDCCCHHTHVFSKIFPDTLSHVTVKKAMMIGPQETLRTAELSSLYRPPIA